MNEHRVIDANFALSKKRSIAILKDYQKEISVFFGNDIAIGSNLKTWYESTEEERLDPNTVILPSTINDLKANRFLRIKEQFIQISIIVKRLNSLLKKIEDTKDQDGLVAMLTDFFVPSIHGTKPNPFVK